VVELVDVPDDELWGGGGAFDDVAAGASCHVHVSTTDEPAG
jgi:hypothetical protein